MDNENPDPKPESQQYFALHDLSDTKTSEWNSAEEEESKKIDYYRWRNVAISCANRILFFAFFAIATGSMFDSYIYILHGNSNTWVGILESLAGITCLVASIPAGITIDSFRKENVFRVSGPVVMLSIIIGTFALIYDNTILLFSFVILFNLGIEFLASCNLAILANSLTIKERSKYLTLSGMLGFVGSWIAPISNLIYFGLYSDVWEISVLKIILIFGIFLAGPLFIILSFFLKDISSETVEENEQYKERLNNQRNNNESMQSETTSTSEGGPEESSIQMSINTDQETIDSSKAFIIPLEHFESLEEQRFRKLGKSITYVPYLVIIINIISSIGRGMFNKYMPLFFKEEYGFTPFQFNLILLAQYGLVPFFVYLCHYCSLYVGRPIVIAVVYFMAGSLLISMYYCHNGILMAILFTFRAIFAMCGGPIENALIMDYTRAKNRGKWNAVGSVVTFIWSSSALFGGLIADSSDYRHVIFVSMFFYVISVLAYLPIFKILPGSVDIKNRL